MEIIEDVINLGQARNIAQYIISRERKIVEPYIKALKFILSKNDSKEFVVNEDCYIHVRFDDVKEANELLKRAGLNI